MMEGEGVCNIGEMPIRSCVAPRDIAYDVYGRPMTYVVHCRFISQCFVPALLLSPVLLLVLCSWTWVGSLVFLLALASSACYTTPMSLTLLREPYIFPYFYYLVGTCERSWVGVHARVHSTLRFVNPSLTKRGIVENKQHFLKPSNLSR